MRGKDLKNFRANKGIKQEELAELFGLDLDAVKHMEEAGQVDLIACFTNRAIDKSFDPYSLLQNEGNAISNPNCGSTEKVTSKTVINKFIKHTNDLLDKGNKNDPNTQKWIHENVKTIIGLHNEGWWQHE